MVFAKYRKFILAIALVMLIAIVCFYVRGRKAGLLDPEPGLLDSGIAAVEGRMYVPQRGHWYPITANDKDNPDVLKELAAVLSVRHWDPDDDRKTPVPTSLTLTLHNGKTVGVDGSTGCDAVFIEGREYLVNESQLDSALNALLKASLAKLPEGDTIALTGNILAVDGWLDWPLGKNEKLYMVRFSTEKDPRTGFITASA